MNAIFNRIARRHIENTEGERFDALSQKVQEIIEANDPQAFTHADEHMSEMRDLFFSIAWRDHGYVNAWFKRLRTESYLFPDEEEFKGLLKEGEAAAKTPDTLRDVVKKMLAARVALGASDTAGELATIVKA
jgi:hypothetical protein